MSEILSPEKPIQIMHPFSAAVRDIGLEVGDSSEVIRSYFENVRRILVMSGYAGSFVAGEGFQYFTEKQREYIIDQAKSPNLNFRNGRTGLNAIKTSFGYSEYTLVTNRPFSASNAPRFVDPALMIAEYYTLPNIFEQNFNRLQGIYEGLQGRIGLLSKRLARSEINPTDESFLMEMGFISQQSGQSYLNVEGLRGYIAYIKKGMYLDEPNNRTARIIDATPVIGRRSFGGAIMRWFGDKLLGYPYDDPVPMIAKDIAAKTRILGLTGTQVEPVLNREGNDEAIRCSSGISADPIQYFRVPITELDNTRNVVPWPCVRCARRSDCTDLRNYVINKVVPKNGLEHRARMDATTFISKIYPLVRDGYVFYV